MQSSSLSLRSFSKKKKLGETISYVNEDGRARLVRPFSREFLFENLQLIRKACGLLVNSNRTQTLLVMLIAVDALMIGIATYPFVRLDPKLTKAFNIFDSICLIVFTAELIMQFIFHGWRMFLDGWLLFDTSIVVTSWALSHIQFARSFRILRAFRLITRAQIMQNMLLAIIRTMPRMNAIILLLTLVSYIFSVMLTDLFKNLYANHVTQWDYFGRLDQSLFTLFQIMTKDKWGELTREIMVIYPWAWLPITVYIIAAAFVAANIIIAILCDVISQLHSDDKAKLLGRFRHQPETRDLVESREHQNQAEQLDQLLNDLLRQVIDLELRLERSAKTQHEILASLNAFLKRLEHNQNPEAPNIT